MSGSEFIAQRKLAFHVLGSEALPSTYFPADTFVHSLRSSGGSSRRVCRSGRGGLTCVDGPHLEQVGVLFHLPAVPGRMLPGNGEQGFLL